MNLTLDSAGVLRFTEVITSIGFLDRAQYLEYLTKTRKRFFVCSFLFVNIDFVKKLHMKIIIGKFLCWLGTHELDEDEWHDAYGWNEEYLHSNNFCKRCNKMIQRRLG